MTGYLWDMTLEISFKVRGTEGVCVPGVVFLALREGLVAFGHPVFLVGLVPVTVPGAAARGEFIAALDIMNGPEGLIG